MKNKEIIIKFIEWLIYMVGYAIVLIIFILNKTIKPLLVWLTLPITALTLGLFYPFINVLILYIVSWILGPHFEITGGLLTTFIMALSISLMNLIMKKIIKEILEGAK